MRRFEVREFRARKLAQLALIGSCAFVENNKGVRRLAPFFIGQADYGNLLHAGMAQQDAFDFDGRNVFAAADDDVL